MSPDETLALCRLVKAVCPSQALDQYTPDAWHLILGHIDYSDAKAAVARLAALDLEPGRSRYIEPGHIIAQVRRIRAQRLTDHGPLIPPPGLDGTTEYLAWIRQASAVVASGGSLPTPPAVAADPGRSAAAIASIRDALPTAPTIRALDEENAQSQAPQHPNPYRQPEGNRA